MTRRGKRGKLKKRVSHSFHRAWKSGEEHAGFPHFHRPSDGSLSQASGARRPCSPPSKAVISRLLFSLRHFKLTGGIRCTFPIPCGPVRLPKTVILVPVARTEVIKGPYLVRQEAQNPVV